MAWYRAGGGGIPSSLKTDMNDVLNKKFGTSQDYPPTDWAPTVNLMGPLPEKTASGAIVTFPDGADEVPIKSWEVEIAPTLTGKSAIEATQTGKNLFDKTNPNEVDGYFTTTGFSTGNANAKTIYIQIKSGATYTVSKTAGQRFQIATAEVPPANNAVFTGRVAQSGSQTSLTITASANDKYLWAWVFLNGTDTGTLDDMLASVQIEVGSTATAYEPYTAPTQYTASLGRTIYGGTADVVNGQGSGECVKVKFSDLTWFTNLLNGARQFYAVLSDSKTPINNNTILDGLLCYGYNVTYANDVYLDTSVGDKISVNTGNTLQVRDYSVTTLEEFIAKTANYELVYPLATPTDFTFTPITPTPETALGVNNFWAEQGDSEVTYRADINLALGGQ